MESSRIFIAISIVLLLGILLYTDYMLRESDRKKLTPLAGLGFGFVLAGILFGENRLTGYLLIGTGITLAVIDILIKFRKGNKKP